MIIVTYGARFYTYSSLLYNNDICAIHDKFTCMHTTCTCGSEHTYPVVRIVLRTLVVSAGNGFAMPSVGARTPGGEC